MRNKKKVFLGCAATGLLLFQTIIGHTAAASPMEMNFLKVGKADAIVIQSAGKTVVVDAGEEDDGEEIVQYIKSRGITEIDVLIITHFDKDHVGGADTLVEELEVKRVLLPDYPGQGTEFWDFMDALDAKEITPEWIWEKTEFSIADMKFEIDPPASYETGDGVQEYDNNFSLVTTITHENNRLLLTGDMEKQRIREWLSEEEREPYQFLKVPHHGVYNRALAEMFATVEAEYAVICCSQKNPADEKTVELLKTYGTQVLETKNGDITVISDGNGLEVRQ